MRHDVPWQWDVCINFRHFSLFLGNFIVLDLLSVHYIFYGNSNFPFLTFVYFLFKLLFHLLCLCKFNSWLVALWRYIIFKLFPVMCRLKKNDRAIMMGVLEKYGKHPKNTLSWSENRRLRYQSLQKWFEAACYGIEVVCVWDLTCTIV